MSNLLHASVIRYRVVHLKFLRDIFKTKKDWGRVLDSERACEWSGDRPIGTSYVCEQPGCWFLVLFMMYRWNIMQGEGEKNSMVVCGRTPKCTKTVTREANMRRKWTETENFVETWPNTEYKRSFLFCCFFPHYLFMTPMDSSTPINTFAGVRSSPIRISHLLLYGILRPTGMDDLRFFHLSISNSTQKIA